MYLKRIHLVFVYCFLLITACIDPFELSLEDSSTEFLVIDGSFTPDSRPHDLRIYYTNSQFERRRRNVEGAKVRLIAEEGLEAFYQEIGEGNYQLPNDKIQGKVGGVYFIEIDLANGEKYRSIPASIPEKIRGDSAYIQFNFIEEVLITGAITKKSFLEVFVDSPLPQNGSDYWLKWDVSTLYSFPEALCGPIPPPPLTCFIPGRNDPQQVILLNGARFNSQRIQGLKVSEKRLMPTNYEFRGRHYFLVNQQSIPKEAYDYWEKVNKIANQTGSIFDAPPAAIPGNIFNVNKPEEVVLGYFEMQHTDSLRTFITSGELSPFYKFPTIVCPNIFNPFTQFLRECCNCTRIENSSTNRPSWF